MDAVTYIEIDLPGGGNTLRFTHASDKVDTSALPILERVSVTPPVIDPGRSIGQRESVSVSFKDCLYRFDTDSFNAGTFWTKLRARCPTLQGCALRVIRGEVGQPTEDMTSLLYIIDSLQLSDDGATIKAKDPLSMLSSDAAQAPLISRGELSQSIDANTLSITLTPVGVGNLDYKSTGKVCIGGSEIVSFTRSGDILTLSTRGENTEAIAHEAGSKVQQVLWYNNQTPSAIIYDLLTNYTNIDPAWITLTDWEAAVDDYIGRVYGAQIVTPVSVKKLLDELCEQVGLVIWWDAAAKQIRLKPLLPVTTSKTVSPDNILDGSFRVTEQPDKRVSQIWTFYGQRDATQSLDEESNYQRVVIKIADNESDYQQPAIRKVFSRWISFAARSTAERLNDLVIARFSVPPRKFEFDLFHSGETLPKLGGGVSVEHWRIVDGDGNTLSIPSQIISESTGDDRTTFVAEEMVFTPPESIGGSPTDKTKYVFIDGDIHNANLRTLYNQIYTSPEDGDQIIFVVESGVKVGSTSTTTPALSVGTWSENVDLQLVNNGRIQGKGGDGGFGFTFIIAQAEDGRPGGPALYARRNITLVNNGVIAGGGGGGAGGTNGHGGGGAGFDPGLGGTAQGTSAQPGTAFSGGNSTGNGGNGGAPGQAGNNSSIRTGGAAGIAVDGDSYITWSSTGTILGATVN